jgi:hypothetical protein
MVGTSNQIIVSKIQLASEQSTDMTLVFMTNPDPTEFQRYPICKVSTIVAKLVFQANANVISKIGDFGSARISYEMDTNNPFWYDPITPGYVPPEIDHDNTHDHKAWEMSNATNVSCVSRTWKRPVYMKLTFDIAIGLANCNDNRGSHETKGSRCCKLQATGLG